MSSKVNLIRVFEHQKIHYGREYQGVLFKEEHFNALLRHNEKNKNKYFTFINRGIQFSQYVGVVQVGNLIIEILPKADVLDPENSNEKNQQLKKWHDVLFEMLRVCRWLPLEAQPLADLSLRNATLLDIYLELFLNQVEKILHQGLIRQYRQIKSNQPALKGTIQFQKHLSLNLVHRERFFVRHQVYDTTHLLHQLLFKALCIIPNLTLTPTLNDKVGRLLLAFPEMPDIVVTNGTFEKIRFNRKTEQYKQAIELAELILRNYNPDVKNGENHILAILFDMNHLFEEYVYWAIKRFVSEGVTISRQMSRRFWERKSVRPDIVIDFSSQRFVLDTKWKVLRDAKPSDDDLKQMYVYHHYFKTEQTLLLYPQVYGLKGVIGKYAEENNQCRLEFLNVLDASTGKLNRNLGEEILKILEW